MAFTRHVYPQKDRRPHVTDGLDCWCRPWRRNNCPECEDSPSRECYSCRGSRLVDACCDSQPDLIIHHRNGNPLA